MLSDKRTGADTPHWYVGCVRSCQEKNVAATLQAKAVQCYLPLRREIRQWSDRRKVVESLVVPRFIFVRCLNSERAGIMQADPRIWRFLSFSGKPAVVGDEEMDAFRRMVENGGREVRFTGETLAPGDRVRVTSGPLTGLECELLSVGAGRCLAVKLGLLGSATMDLDVETVEKI